MTKLMLKHQSADCVLAVCFLGRKSCITIGNKIRQLLRVILPKCFIRTADINKIMPIKDGFIQRKTPTDSDNAGYKIQKVLSNYTQHLFNCAIK
ncbi:hypothetical protein [Mucilaginibacter lacusdianchii]|uniref:hypothetical protein n=1 Tax=Mucilaginibacter lacusdianchii TaxID=2684211 RepID=UPI00131DCAAA|nr:hypothetical protein [Mucilaginibacter sp. JXJ CY 39]